MEKGYKEYQKTDLPWIEKVPKHWKWLRNKNLLIERKDCVGQRKNNFILLSLTKQGVIIRDIESGKGKFPKDFDTYKVVDIDDMIFCLFDVDETPRTVGISKHKGMITGAYDVFRVQNIVLNYVYYYYLAFDNLKAFKPLYSGLRKVIPLPIFMSLKTPVPPKAEQDQIVRYLDWKTGEIDRFIKQQTIKINFLEELRAKQIDEFVTSGLSDSINKKVSHADWMGKVPTNWEEYRLKNLFTETNLRSLDGKEPHLSMSQKRGLVTDDEVIERTLLSESYIGAKICEKEDLVLNRLKAHLGVFALAPILGVVSPDYTVLRIDKKKVIPRYLEYLLKSNACRKELAIRVRGIVEGFWRLYTEDLGSINICIPPINEQAKILDAIVVFDEKIESMIGSIQKEIMLLEELRTKLIADVVTGQIDVRDVVVP